MRWEKEWIETTVKLDSRLECPCIVYRGERLPPILFLHGYSFKGRTWATTSVFQLLVKENHGFAAPDMPYGKSTGCTAKRVRDLELNLQVARRVVKECLDGRDPIVVGASLGGRVALHYALRYPVRGLLLLSPYVVGDEEVVQLSSRLRGVPAIIVMGERDFVPHDILEDLANKMGAEFRVYPGAGHAMYLDKPDLFKEDLLRLLERTRKKG